LIHGGDYSNAQIQEFVAAVQATFEPVPLTAEIAICAAELPHPFHGDPMDRIIAATAIAGGALVAHDNRIGNAKVCEVLW
jgi:PIN domain nuclease of toxin-antitoxin system